MNPETATGVAASDRGLIGDDPRKLIYAEPRAAVSAELLLLEAGYDCLPRQRLARGLVVDLVALTEPELLPVEVKLTDLPAIPAAMERAARERYRAVGRVLLVAYDTLGEPRGCVLMVGDSTARCDAEPAELAALLASRGIVPEAAAD